MQCLPLLCALGRRGNNGGGALGVLAVCRGYGRKQRRVCAGRAGCMRWVCGESTLNQRTEAVGLRSLGLCLVGVARIVGNRLFCWPGRERPGNSF
jgi:hypothetical protein